MHGGFVHRPVLPVFLSCYCRNPHGGVLYFLRRSRARKEEVVCMFYPLGQTRHCCGSHSSRSCWRSDCGASNCRCWHCRENARPVFLPFFQPALPGSEVTVLMPDLPGDGRISLLPPPCGRRRGIASPSIPPAAGLRQLGLGQTRQRSGTQTSRSGWRADCGASNGRSRQSRENARRCAHAG